MVKTRKDLITILIIGLVLLVLLITAGVKYFLSINQTESLVTGQTTVTEANGLTCYSNSQYFLIAKDGGHNLLKYKTKANQNIACEYNIGKNDFEFGNGVEYFLAFVGNHLITDSGTAPGLRGLTVYDLDTRKEVYQGYHDSSISVKDNTISYWTKSGEKVTRENCPQLDEYSAEGFGAVRESYVTLDLGSLSEKAEGQYRCQLTQ